MALFQGLGTAIVTPFDKNNNINYNVFEMLIEHQIENGSSAIIVCGTTGEASTLTYEERSDLVKFAVKTANKRIKIIAGGGSNSTQVAIRLCKDAAKHSPDGLLIVTPYYNKTTQKGLISHYKAISDSVDLPIILYNVPTRTSLNIEPETAYELSKIQNIVGIKEASTDIAQAARLASLTKDMDFDLYAANDNELLPMLSLGAIGIISVFGNIAPKSLVDIINNFKNGNIYDATNLQLNSIPIIESLFYEMNPMPVKYILNLMGYDVGICRLPLVELENETTILIKKIVKEYGLAIQ